MAHSLDPCDGGVSPSERFAGISAYEALRLFYPAQCRGIIRKYGPMPAIRVQTITFKRLIFLHSLKKTGERSQLTRKGAFLGR
jgi:hypothetical protein